MTNPFENETGEFIVLVNHEGQYSLWPVFCSVPEGWTVVVSKRSRQECLDWIQANWTDMRPNSLIEAEKRAAK